MKQFVIEIERTIREIYKVEANNAKEAGELYLEGEAEYSHESETVEEEIINIDEVEF